MDAAAVDLALFLLATFAAALVAVRHAHGHKRRPMKLRTLETST
jgi:hypothetical protein